MLAGHCDQIGLIVSHINECGYIYTNTIGGWDPQHLVGQRVTIYTTSGPIPAVISRKAIHLIEQDERKNAVKHKDLWLDIGAKDREEAAAAVEIGDPVDHRVLVGEVVVEGHRLDTELLAELPHAEGLEPTLIGELDRGV